MKGVSGLAPHVEKVENGEGREKWHHFVIGKGWEEGREEDGMALGGQ